MSSGDAGSCGPEGTQRAAAALCGLYREAGQRLRLVQEQLAARDGLVERLRARLAALEGDAAPSLVDALLEQVARLREQLRERESGAAEAELRQEVERLSHRLAKKEQEMEQLLGHPALASEKELVQLRRSVAEKERVRAVSHVLCRSLADESQQLRRTLAATAHMCQHLAKCLEECQAPQAAPRESGAESESPGRAAVQAATVKLQEENRLLKEKVAHVEDLNAKWQRYDASRDEYVRGLQAQLRGLQVPAEPERPSTCERMRKEIARLNGQLEEKMLTCAEVKQELLAARSAWDAALERVQMLEQQILAYKEDFAWERADRERAQSRVQELEEKLACLQQAGRQGPLEPAFCWTHAANSSPEALERAVSSDWRSGDGACRQEPPGMPLGDLQCPHCLQCFSDEQGEELFRHVRQCCQ